MDKARRRYAILVAGGALAAAAGLTFQAILRKQDEGAIASLWSLPLLDLEGNSQPLTRWRGKILVINFWATWCAPCRVRDPELIKTQNKYASKSVQIVGISIDSASKVREFAIEFKIQYPLVIGSLEGIEVTRKLGNKAAALPYTLVLNSDGTIVARHLGGISEAQLDEAIRPLLDDPKQISS